MATHRLEFLPAAASEVLEAGRWYFQRSPRAAAGFEREVSAAFERIVASPEVWAEHHCGTRRVLLKRFPYEIIFRVYADRIVIVAVAHCERRPTYWRDR